MEQSPFSPGQGTIELTSSQIDLPEVQTHEINIEAEQPKSLEEVAILFRQSPEEAAKHIHIGHIYEIQASEDPEVTKLWQNFTQAYLDFNAGKINNHA